MSGDDHAGGLLTIDLGAVAANYRLLSHASGTECAAVVKADAYGLGMAEVAPTLAAAGCRRFFVALTDEGIALRRLLPDAPIYVLNGPVPGAEAALVEHRLTPVLNDLGQIAGWAAAAAARAAPLAALLHIDTGMTRLGLDAAEIRRLADEPDRLAGIETAYVMSHLACAEDAGHPKNAEQLAAFRAARERLASLPGLGGASLANSSGIFLGPDYRFDLVRPGAALFGVNPTPDRPNPMAQTVHLQGRILQLRDVDRPMTVGYGATHSVARKGKVIT
ncbi:MAG: alanine racemase, partial [Alphaproteobacteria bacterium]